MCGGSAAALNVTESGGSRLGAGKLLELVCNDRADTAETNRVCAVLDDLGDDLLAVKRLCALGYRDDGELLAACLVCLDLLCTFSMS